MAPEAINRPFARFGAAAKSKLLWLGGPDFPQEGLLHRARSLHIEHVSSAGMKRREISRRPGTEDSVLAHMRRWFFARKPDAGFVLTDFPATLLQAKVLDEWLDARGECLDAIAAGPGAAGDLVAHYRGLGLLAAAADLPALLGAGEGPPVR